MTLATVGNRACLSSEGLCDKSPFWAKYHVLSVVLCCGCQRYARNFDQVPAGQAMRAALPGNRRAAAARCLSDCQRSRAHQEY